MPSSRVPCRAEPTEKPHADLILHHYPSSPFSEKIRLVLGYKKLAWKSVHIPAIMPKPDVVALTGGYRKHAGPAGRRRHLLRLRTDLRRAGAPAPEPALYPRTCKGVAASSPNGPTPRCSGPRWPTTCSPRARPTCSQAPPEAGKAFGEDRKAMSVNTRLRPGDATSAYRSYLRRIANMADEHDFLFGAEPCVADFAAYHALWYTRVQALDGRHPERDALGERVDGPHGRHRPRADEQVDAPRSPSRWPRRSRPAATC